MENDGIEMGKMRFDDEEIASNALPEPMDWVHSKIRRQNRCFVLLIASVVIAGAVYILEGVNTQDGKASMEDYDAQDGIVTNNENNAKAQEAFGQAQEQKNGHASGWFSNHGKGGSQNENPSPNDLAKWNKIHPGVPYPEYKRGPFGKQHGGAIGKVNHGGAHKANSNNDIISGEGSTEDNQESKCEDLTQYEDWLATTVTKKDGKKYETLKQMKHDSKAFTYVYVNGI
jgi:hypothetical protein